MVKHHLRLALILILAPLSGFAATLGPVAGNAIRDNNLDNIPDELTPSSSNYVYNALGESRTFVEFNIGSLAPVTSASLQFTAFRYNAEAQQIQIYSYLGNGLVELSDWNSASTLLATTSVIDGYTDFAHRGEAIPFSFDITSALSAAQSVNAPYFSIYFRDPTPAADVNGALVTVGNFSIATPSIATASVPDHSSTGLLTLLSLAACIALRRRT